MVIVESIGVAALGWVASPLVGKLLNEGFESLGIDAEEKLQELRATALPVLKSVIEKAEGSAHRSEVEDWLQRLKDAYEDAEDALDLLNYWRLEREAANRVRLFRVPKPPKLIMPILKGGRDMISLRKIKLKRKLNKLEKIALEALKLRDLLGAQADQTAAGPDSRQTIWIPPLKVFGRDKNRDEIIRRLKMDTVAIRDPGSSSMPTSAIHNPGSSSMPTIASHEPGSLVIPIIAIVGRPGVGKTTLAQYICKQLKSEGRDGHFHPIMWVHTSHNFNVSEIMKNIIQAACTASEPQDPINLNTVAVGNLDTPENLQQKMSTMLTAKKFLLVIDDVWCDGDVHKNNWDTLFRCLSNCCSLGSKILVTSQTKDAPRKIVAAKSATLEYIHDLKELEENDFINLFIHYAFPSSPEINSPLKEKCKAIAQKLNKDPTAAELVGMTIHLSHLSANDDWHTYLRTIAEDWSGDKTKALMWSYRHLPPHLQRCFSYCSLYPVGYMFKELELVQLWIAQGFIKPDGRNERIEDVGSQYLKELVSRFYIQSHDKGYRFSRKYLHGSYYTLHELLYDLAEKVSRNYCVRIEGNRCSEITSTIRHLCIPANKLKEKKEKICRLKKLRTLIVVKGESVISEENVATDLFKSLKKLRVLVLELNLEISIEFIREMRHLREMKHLRFLQVFGTSNFLFPESLCTLYLLQVLELEKARLLPKCLNNLVNLRHLHPSGIFDHGKLTQCLNNIRVSKEKGNELEQLLNLNELRGILHIENLEDVKSKKSASAANLKEKKYLDELELLWHDAEDNVNSNLDVEILNGLQLPPNLTRLYLEGYRGPSCLEGYRGPSWPSWPECQTSNIEKLELRRCKMLEELPRMDQLYPSCRSLVLWGLSKLKALHTLPWALQYLEIGHCWALTCLGGIGSLPHLKELFLTGCPCLDSETAFLPSSLEKIQFETCANVDAILANAELPCLYDLTIRQCRMRRASLQFGNLPSLRSLRIGDCRGLSSSVDLQELRSLELLALQNCSNLQEVINFPGSIKHLIISKCPILERSMNIDPCSRVLMLSGIPVEDMDGFPLIREEEKR